MPQDAEVLRSTLSLAPVIPVIILDDVRKARPLAEALVGGGLPVLEVTLRTPHALQVIEEMARVPGAVVGSGTVRSPLQMGHSVDAGAKFMVSPGASPRLLEAADDVSIPLLPGRRWLAVVGSVGQPRDGNAAAAYCLLDTVKGDLTYCRAPYDVQGAADSIRKAGLPPHLAERLYRGR